MTPENPWHGLPARGQTRRAFALVIVLVAVAAVTLVLITLQSTALRHAYAGREAVALTRAEWAARAGLESAIARLAYNIENADAGSSFTTYEDMADLSQGTVEGAAWEVLYDDEQYEREGPADAHAKMNVNRMSHDDLLELQYMTEDVADAIIDWIDEDDTPSEFGAEEGSYASVNPPYEPRNGPVRSIRELELVRGVQPDLLRGEDWNLNGRLDPNEDDGDLSWPADNSNGVLDAGWSEHITASSVDFGLAFSGEERLDLSIASADELTSRMSFLSTAQAQAVLEHARNPQATIWDYIITPLTTIARQSDAIPDNISDLSFDEIEELIDEVTLNPASAGPVPGRLNLNTCQRDTLDLLAAIDATTADILLLERNARGGAGFTTMFDLLDIPGVTPTTVAVLSPFIDVRPNSYVVTSRGRDEGTGIEVELTATIERSALPVPVTSLIIR